MAASGRVVGAEASGVDAVAAAGPSASTAMSRRRSDSIDGLKEHLSPTWAPASSDGEHEHEPLMDPNLPDDGFELMERTRRPDEDGLLAHDELKVPGLAAEGSGQDEDSPYPEVRAAIRNYDEQLACNTVRAWVIGLSLVVVGASMNTLFSLRQPSISIGSLVGQIVAWPLGHAWARFMPDARFNTLGLRWRLNSGPFTVKEHTIIGVMASVSFSVAYSTDIILAQLVFYKQNFGLPFQLLLTISTQSIGYGIAGVMRKFLGWPFSPDPFCFLTPFASLSNSGSHVFPAVYPASMIWPGILVAVTLMNAMYEQNDVPNPSIVGGSMPRFRWFLIVAVASFFYYFIPGFLAQCLSVFAFATWIAPQNAVVNQLFGGTTGLSLVPITFDWTQIAGWVGSPLIPPW